jgi:uncharacterized protein YijF (DUF1287 family)
MINKMHDFKLYPKLMMLTLALSLALSLQIQPIVSHSTQISLDAQHLLLTSSVDKDKDGIDDYTDIMLGARADAQNMPVYDDSYFGGGYPPDDIGVCADTIWRALMAAGYNLKDLIDEDIRNHPEAYPRISKPDPNIDFRRVRNLRIFFDRHLVSLTVNIYDIDQWQPGDIVIMYEDFHHTGIVSDQRNFMGIPYLIHNTGQRDREEDILMYAYYHAKITRHYRWIYTP